MLWLRYAIGVLIGAVVRAAVGVLLFVLGVKPH